MIEQSESCASITGNRIWYLPSKGKSYWHREDGPAVEWVNGTNEWWVNNKLHRLDGPAVEWVNGTNEWWVNNKQHRLDGPAVERRTSGEKAWWVNGNNLPNEEVETWLEENKVDLKTPEGQMAFKLMWT